MDSIWQEVKEYFAKRDRSSDPWQFRNDLCAEKHLPTGTSTHNHGLIINQGLMGLFTSMGQVSPPICTCSDLELLSSEVDRFIQFGLESDVKDYSLHTGKDEETLKECITYAFRDSLQFWALWTGGLQPELDGWKILYIVFTSCCDDICIPPQDLKSGRFHILGHSLNNVLEGLKLEGVYQKDIKDLEMLLLRESIGQYLEKVDPKIQKLLRGKTTTMTQFRVRTANGEGAALAVLASKIKEPLASYYENIELAGICVCLSMDVAKEGLGVLHGEPTETGAGKNREQLKSELRWLLDRAMQVLMSRPESHLLNWFAASGLLLPSQMERYRERVSHIRTALTPQMQEQIRLTISQLPRKTDR